MEHQPSACEKLALEDQGVKNESKNNIYPQNLEFSQCIFSIFQYFGILEIDCNQKYKYIAVRFVL
jgi:hypothetical protein